MQKKTFSFAVGALLLSAGVVSAATLTDNLNLRSGPGLRYDVIGAVPAGSDVRVMNCAGSWCRVAWNDTQGYVSRRFISRGGPVYAGSPTTGYIAPRYGYGYGYGYAQTQSSSWAPNPGMGYGGGWWNR
jgi:uncharacterized protein YraI